MTARLTSKLLATALIRRAEAEGGFGTVIARGDPGAGAILIVVTQRGDFRAVMERSLDAEGKYCWLARGPEEGLEEPELVNFLQKKREIDPDLWIIELDIAAAERFIEETGTGV
ncbi:MAG: DUF1491 family protein [Sphingomonadaceae bacterium]